ncbi:MAG: type IV secretory system conjugative DNA transfer family protein, partial [Beijerinckiaceae bacterium]|nr:type IV secretory system conjugative DNA transfer family protein [Beijerinckiaceae bacterium]
RAALLGSTAAAAGAAWTVAASAAFLWGTGLWDAFPYPAWQWWQYLAVAGTNATVDYWLKASAAVATGLVGALGGRLWWIYGRREKPLHGESHFATRREAEGSGIVFAERPVPDGIVLGKWGRGPFARYACLPGQQHVAVYAPTEEGKGVSFVVPNAMNWGGSLVAFSVKRDLVQWTAAERARKQNDVFVLDFGDPEGRTHRWNPLGLVRRGTPDATDDLQKAMFALIPEQPKATNPYWSDAGRRIATALAVVQSETPGAPLTVAAVAALARRADCAANLRAMIEKARADRRPYPRSAVDTLLGWADGLDRNSEEARGVRQTILTALALWEVPRIAAATAASDFDVRELRSRRMSVYLCAQPSDLRRMRPIYAIFFQQLIDAMAREEFGEKKEHRHRVLLILDEFWALGEHRVLADATAFIRSSGLRMAIVVQSKDQTRLSFGEDGSRNIYANMGAELALGGLDQRQAEEVSQRGGVDTVVETSRNRPRFLGWLHPHKQSESETVRRRALMLAQEVQRLPPDKLLVLRRRLGLLMLDRLVWYRDAFFRRRGGSPPDTPTLAVQVERDAAPAAQAATAGGP